MPLVHSSGAPKVTKMLQKYNSGLIALLLASWPNLVQALPVAVAWQVPLNPAERYVLQVARKPGFGQLLLNQLVQGNGFTWDTPGEGVYHWRLLRPEKTGHGIEGSTFVSGSFVAVEGGKRDAPATISWQPVPGADRYKLYLVDQDGQTRTMISSTSVFTLPTLSRPVMIEVVPYSGAQRTFRDYHFQPSLKFDAGDGRIIAPTAIVRPAAVGTVARTQGGSTDIAGARISKSPGAVGRFGPEHTPTYAATPLAPGLAAEEPNQAAVGKASGAMGTAPATAPRRSIKPVVAAGQATGSNPAAKPAAAVATPTDEASEASAGPGASPGVRRRRHLVYGMFVYEEDALEFSKLELSMTSRQGFLGVGGGFWLNPISGLIVSGQGSYHEHRNVFVDDVRFPNEKILIEQARYTGTLDLGFNVLAPFGVERHILSLGVSGGATQLPALPVRYDITSGLSPEFERYAYNLIGAHASYGWLSDRLGIVVDGTAARATEDEAQLAQGRLMLDIYPGNHFAIILGGFYRQVGITRCDPDAARCLVEGKVRTDARETGGFIGMGAVLM